MNTKGQQRSETVAEPLPRPSNGRSDASDGRIEMPSFVQVMQDGFDHFAAVLRRRRVITAAKGVMVFLLLAALGLALYLPTSQYLNARKQEAEAIAAMSRVQKWPQGKIADEFNRAERYNAAIAASGQQFMGEFPDPFLSAKDNGKSGHKSKSDRTPTKADTDREYQSLLNEGAGVMGVVEAPEISLKLPIYHGTSDTVLDKGAGHLYGTSLPVGGASTNSVLTGHRGRPNALLFTRLDELEVGDVFYIETLDRTMGYRIAAINVVDPDDTHLYTVVPGKDLVTLMTCTPYGVNTHRLVFTAERRPIPEDIPYLRDANGDALMVSAVTFVALALLGVTVVAVHNRRRWPVRHALPVQAG